jgi:hypothetical protein
VTKKIPKIEKLFVCKRTLTTTKITIFNNLLYIKIKSKIEFEVLNKI